MNDIIAMLFGWMILILPLLLIIFDMVSFFRKKERALFELIAFFIGSVYMMVAFFVWDLPDYERSINIFGMENMHEPVASRYWPALVSFALWGFFSYYFLKFGRKHLPPLVEVFLLGGLYVGCGLCIVFLVQLLGGVHPVQPEGELKEVYKGITYVGPDWLDVLFIVCLCIVPVIFLLHSIWLIVRLVRERAQKQADIQYDNPALQRINLWFLKGSNLFWAGLIATLPILGILSIILILFGQQPDSIILAFTKTSDWILSGEISPPPTAYDVHYLCTVSLRGHRKLVRPLRYGIRRGEKIVVNRQLCVANAFEELIMEKTPRFHRAVRHFYDTYGYPISRHINTAFAADVTYIIMKPLEWAFLLVLYLVDIKPEDRIGRQYLPEDKINQYN